MKILLISQYFWPENFRVNELTEDLVRFGHKVTVLTGYPNYPKGEIFPEFRKNKENFSHFKGAEIIRIPIFPRKDKKFNLILNYVSFLLNSIFYGYFKLRKKNFDLIFTFQLSPVTVGITSIFFAKIKNCPHVFWVLDLWPDTLVALNILKKEWQINICKILVNWIYGQCDFILAQSKNILTEINSYKSVKGNILYFPSWGNSDFFLNNKDPAPEIFSKNIFTILFAGNIGEAQDFPSLIKAVKILSSEGINNFRIIIIGDGSKKIWLKNEIKKLKIEQYFELYRQYPLERMSEFFQHADVLFVSLLNRKVFNMTIPGKIQFYLSSGIPLIGMICGEGAKVIKESKAGLVCDSGDYVEFSQLIKKMIKLKKFDLKLMGENGKRYADKEFSKPLLMKKLNDLFIKIEKENIFKIDINSYKR